MKIEVEFRFRIDEARAREFLKDLTPVKKSFQKDVYFDTDSGFLFKRGIFMRTRNSQKLDFKFNIDDKENTHEDCQEHSFPLPLSGNLDKLDEVCKTIGLSPTPGLEGILQKNDLKEFIVIDKAREKFTDGEFNFCLDNIKGFGTFLEIESIVPEGTDLDPVKKRMIERVSSLKPEFLPIGYIELFVREKDFSLYKQGRYLLEEDKITSQSHAQ